MTARPDTPPAPALQNRPSVAGWFRGLSLRARSRWFVAAIVAGVVTAVTILQVRSFEKMLKDSLTDAARLAARAVADDLQSRPGPLDPTDVGDMLHEIAGADPAVRSISVIAVGEDGTADVLASTQTEERDEVLAQARRALALNSLTTEQIENLLSCAVPVRVSGRPLVAVATVSLAAVERVSTRGRTIGLLFVLPIIVLVTLLVDLAMRTLVHRPVAGIRSTMQQAAQGALSSRAPVVRDDELGAVAVGLNDMLDRLERLNAGLQDRVREATSELRIRNVQLEESYTDMLALREALARTERMAAVGHMAATVAHQAGTPLNLVSGYVQMVREDPAADVRIKQKLDIVDRQIRQVTRVLQSMLDRARQPLRRQVSALGPLVERVCELAGPRLAQSGVRMERDIPARLPAVDVDVVQFELALLALITNALDAMPSGGLLSIRAADDQGHVRIEIADTGGGIHPDLLGSIFEPWMTTKPAGHGTGLGLGIVRDVVRTHGGTVSAHNAQGGGAVFVISLPAAAPARGEGGS